MRRGWSRSPLALLAGLLLTVAAVPRPAAAGEPSRAPEAKARQVSVTPLFDTHTRFKNKKTVKLRFRARYQGAGAPLTVDDISFSLRHGPGDTSIQLPAQELKKGVFEVPFTPAGPGQYWVVAAVRGAAAGSIPAVHLGVVGVMDGLIEVPPEADPDLKHTKKPSARSR